MDKLIAVFIIAFGLYLYVKKRSDITNSINTLPYNFEPDKKPKYYLDFYYGDKLSDHWRFQSLMENKLPMCFLNSKVNVYHIPEIVKPYILTDRKDKVYIWKVINDLSFDGKAEESKEVKKEYKL